LEIALAQAARSARDLLAHASRIPALMDFLCVRFMCQFLSITVPSSFFFHREFLEQANLLGFFIPACRTRTRLDLAIAGMS
jgi:hypothetical protein